MIWVKRLLDGRHRLDHGAALRVVQEGWLLLPDAMLRRHAPVHLATVIHHKRLDHILRSFLEASVFIAGQDDVQVEIAVADMAMAIRQNQLLLLFGEFGGGLDQRAGLVHDLVIVARWQADIVLERLYRKGHQVS